MIFAANTLNLNPRTFGQALEFAARNLDESVQPFERVRNASCSAGACVTLDADSMPRVSGAPRAPLVAGRRRPSRDRDVSAGKIVPFEQERLAARAGERIGEAVAEIERPAGWPEPLPKSR